MAKAQRKGKVFVDYLRNVRGANAVGAFSTRAKEGAPVSVPVDWDELDRLSGPADFTVAEVPLRVLEQGAGRARRPVGAVPEPEAAGAGIAHARPRGLTPRHQTSRSPARSGTAGSGSAEPRAAVAVRVRATST